LIGKLLNKATYIISLKYAPGLLKEFKLLGENIRSHGFTVDYILCKEYSKLENCPSSAEFLTSANEITDLIKESVKLIFQKDLIRIFSNGQPQFICFYNPHPLNIWIARFIRKCYRETNLALYLHDPYKADKNFYGKLKASYITLVELIQGITIKYMDSVISPSDYSAYLFRSRYPRFKGMNYIAPLLVPDYREIEKENRKFFSIVGNVHAATGHDTFIRTTKYIVSQGIEHQLALISSSNCISDYLSSLNDNERKILNVKNKAIINDSEINEIIRESLAVFRLDREVTQSGVIPNSFMNGTPVIARDIPGLTQHVKHKENGYIVPNDCTPEDIIYAMNYVKEHFTILSREARKSYEDIWHEKKWDSYYSWLINLLNNNLDKEK